MIEDPKFLAALGTDAAIRSGGCNWSRSDLRRPSERPGGPKPVKVFGTFGCSFICTPITFDGVNYASDDPCTGHYNFGIYNGQTMVAYLTIDVSTGLPITGPACTAPDKTAGESFPLVFAEFVDTYNFNNDQIWGYSFTGSICFSNTTGSFSGSTTYTIDGGAGFFTGATGTVTDNFSPVTGFLYYLNTGFSPRHKTDWVFWPIYGHRNRHDHTIIAG